MPRLKPFGKSTRKKIHACRRNALKGIRRNNESSRDTSIAIDMTKASRESYDRMTCNLGMANNKEMELHSGIPRQSKIPEDSFVKQEMGILKVNEDIQIKTEVDYNEQHLTVDNPFQNIQLQVKSEYTQSSVVNKQIGYEINKEKHELLIEKSKIEGENYARQHCFATGDSEFKLLVDTKETITNIYDDNIEIKQEEDIEENPYEYSNYHDNQTEGSNEAKALNNIETCLQEEFEIKCESELFEANEHEELNTVAVKEEFDPTVTETHLISNKVINTTSTVTNPQDGLTKSQTTKTLVMEILPMPGSAAFTKNDNPEEILPTTYASDDCVAMDYDNAYHLNSITGNVMSLEQEAYGLLQPKTKTEHPDRPYTCKKCPKAYKSAACLRKHKQVHEIIEKRAMGIIKGRKTRIANMKKKLKQEEKKCKTRVKKEIKVENVSSIVERVKKEGYECTCGKVFRRRSRMETCLRSHNICSDPNSYIPCVTCSKQFKDKEELSLHRKRLHRKRFPCKFCPTDYNTRKELFKHLQIHQKVQVMEYKVLSEVVKGKQKLKCFMCSKTCTELSELKSHVMDDHKEPYVCPHCNGTFAKIIDFGNHTKTDHPEVEGQSVLDVLEAFSKLVKAWKCEECEVQFHEADKLAMHQIERHGPDSRAEPQFQCIDCRRVFISQKGLTSHRRVHHSADAGEEAVAEGSGVMCIECRKVCRDGAALTSHMRLHSAERRYPCKFCDFRFATPEKRRAHAELHTGDMKYVCFICEYQCSSENRLKRHKASPKHISMKAYLRTGKPSPESTSRRSASDSPAGDEWVVVKDEGGAEADAEVDSGDDSSSNNDGEAACNICGERFESEAKMLKHQSTHPFIEIATGDKPTRIFYK
ncbi:unnamed protein product, partial [Iphiclides podalirius]